MYKKNRPSLTSTLYQPSSVSREKLLWIEKTETILAIIMTSFDGTIVLIGDTNIDTTLFTNI